MLRSLARQGATQGNHACDHERERNDRDHSEEQVAAQAPCIGSVTAHRGSVARRRCINVGGRRINRAERVFLASRSTDRAARLLVADLPPYRTQPVSDKSCHGDHQECGEHVTCDRDAARNGVPGTAYAVADYRYGRCVCGGSDQAQQAEADKWHLAETGDDRDERAHDRQCAPEWYREGAAASKETLRAVDVRPGDQYVPAEPFHQRTATEPAHGVGDVRTGQLGKCAQDDDGGEVEVALVGEHAGEAEGNLRGNRNTTRFDEAQEDERTVACLGQKMLHEPLLYRMAGGRRTSATGSPLIHAGATRRILSSASTTTG